LSCSVRGCARPLERGERAWTCAAGHSFDIARSGYVNLLQPQDRRSPTAGDSSAAIEARASLLASGVGRALIDAVASRAATLDLGGAPVVVDLGCGSGDALAECGDGVTGIGIDLSTSAVERAARRFPDRIWVVANADRRLPLLDHRVDLVLSLHGRRNPVEAARVLTAGRYLLVAIPASDDLIELRELAQGQRIERDRRESVLAEHQPYFDLVEQTVIREAVELERTSLLALLDGTYRGARRGVADRVATLDRMRVTVASDVLLFRLR
jgi:23S rRNA (guanine745-N1)-methyltransferase